MNQRIDTSGTNREVASWIWRNLVPPRGQATTVQGELLRAVEKLRWEAQENGNINWDEGFLILLSFLETQLVGHAGFGESDQKTIQRDVHRLRNFLPVDELDDESDSGSLPYVEDDLYDRLEEFVVAFSRANPVALPHAANPLLHR
jgi:hypothetical protein